jgi:hypothetical protein
MSEVKYWHQISQEEIVDLIEKGTTNQYIVDNYKQPEWCSYHEALMGQLGCWSLVDNTPDGLRTKISESFCSNCDCFEKS